MDPVVRDFVLRLGLDLAAVTWLVRLVYFRQYRRSDLLLTFYALNIAIFLIALLLSKVEMTMGAAFGLFAVFSMLRYRTEGISAKDMTYLFLVIALGLLMAVAPGGPALLAGTAAVVVLCTQGLESGFLAPREHATPVHYDNITLVHSASREALIADLKARTGLDVQRVDVEEIDFIRDAARLTVYSRGGLAR